MALALYSYGSNKGDGVSVQDGVEATDDLKKALITKVRAVIGAFAAPDIIHWVRRPLRSIALSLILASLVRGPDFRDAVGLALLHLQCCLCRIGFLAMAPLFIEKKMETCICFPWGSVARPVGLASTAARGGPATGNQGDITVHNFH